NWELVSHVVMQIDVGQLQRDLALTRLLTGDVFDASERRRIDETLIVTLQEPTIDNVEKPNDDPQIDGAVCLDEAFGAHHRRVVGVPGASVSARIHAAHCPAMLLVRVPT